MYGCYCTLKTHSSTVLTCSK
uniref:Uncharacterized protein n=1 Tax=Anguilla anguilla TaxID=7936 RepID=A0A0E9W300_ANGAN